MKNTLDPDYTPFRKAISFGKLELQPKVFNNSKNCIIWKVPDIDATLRAIGMIA